MVQEIAAMETAPVVETLDKKVEQAKRQDKGPPPAQPKGVSEEKIQQLTDEANSVVKPLNTKLSFSFDNKSGKNIIKIVDGDSGKVIRQIPPEEMVRLSEHIKELLGALVDKHA